MDQFKEKSKLEQWTIALAALLSLAFLARLFRESSLTGLLWTVVMCFVAVLMLSRGKEDLFRWAFPAVGAVGLFGFFAGYAWGLYQPDWLRSDVSFLCLLPGLLMLFGQLGVAALGGLLYAKQFPALGDTLRKYWYVPALAFAVCFVYSLLLGFALNVVGNRHWIGFSEYAGLRTLLWAGLAFCLGWRAAGHDALPSRSAPADAETPAPAVKYCSAAKLLFLTLITLGIWMLVWIWRTTATLAPYEDRHPRKPWLETLCCLLLPFYVVYWLYKSAQLAALAADGEEDRRFSTLCLILAALLTPIAMLLVQDKLNVLADREEEIEVEFEVVEAAPVEDEPEAEPVEEEPVPVEDEPAPIEDEPVPVEDEPVSVEEDVPVEDEPAAQEPDAE
ncbi:MAG: DUF4234 domain-containing protein [Oscillospiraceae bacterium]|nr:DUF4234 domain-containing protein [Oscillospiraceae bacterium]